MAPSSGIDNEVWVVRVADISYVLRYMIRRAFRVAKYAAIGAAVAMVGTGVLGALGTGIAWFAAPTMLGSMGLGVGWAILKVSLSA